MAEESGNRGGAAPALAAHSKDASTPGPTPASSASENPLPHAASVREQAIDALDASSKQAAQAVTPAADFIRAQPFAAVAMMGGMCFALGLLLRRR
jgi:ElaB/YqjD/DUF883 family membrane-anchored ribosome-binding protein